LDTIQQLKIFNDKTKIKRRFHKCKPLSKYFLILPFWEKLLPYNSSKTLQGRALEKPPNCSA
jgi:hypothetical protein